MSSPSPPEPVRKQLKITEANDRKIRADMYSDSALHYGMVVNEALSFFYHMNPDRGQLVPVTTATKE